MNFPRTLLNLLAVTITLGAPALGPNAFAAPPARSALAPEPDWTRLEAYQQTITRKEFLALLDSVYAPEGAWRKTITVTSTAAVVHPPGKGKVEFRLKFAPGTETARPAPRYWHPVGSHPKKQNQPLAGYTIALDPGHIGGRWAKMEERWFRIGKSAPVMEGAMALQVARLVEDRLTARGARVVFVRNRMEPVTPLRPADLRKEALAELRRKGIHPVREHYDGPDDPLKMNSVAWQSEMLFYRVSEIRARARLVNESIKPDLVVCLHFNAEAWGDPANPRLSEKNHLHLLVNGNYGEDELALEDVRFDMLIKLLNRSAREELGLAGTVANSLARATGLPPYVYHDRARRVSENPYVWGRNLLANRLYHCPVIFCEPYVMNSQPVFERVEIGDYRGKRLVQGKERKSIYREYADAVANGITHYFDGRVAPARK